MQAKIPKQINTLCLCSCQPQVILMRPTHLTQMAMRGHLLSTLHTTPRWMRFTLDREWDTRGLSASSSVMKLQVRHVFSLKKLWIPTAMLSLMCIPVISPSVTASSCNPPSGYIRHSSTSVGSYFKVCVWRKRVTGIRQTTQMLFFKDFSFQNVKMF